MEQGITNGMDLTHFGPEVPCTRAHVVTFLWRAHEKPIVVTVNPFADVPADEYYTDAVLWAVSKGITNGTPAEEDVGLYTGADCADTMFPAALKDIVGN